MNETNSFSFIETSTSKKKKRYRNSFETLYVQYLIQTFYMVSYSFIS